MTIQNNPPYTYDPSLDVKKYPRKDIYVKQEFPSNELFDGNSIPKVIDNLLNLERKFQSFYPGLREDTIRVDVDYQRTYYDGIDCIVEYSGNYWESDHDYLNRIDADKAAVARAKEQKAIAAKKAAEDEKELYIRLHAKYGSGIK
jgi:hypothetical protein